MVPSRPLLYLTLPGIALVIGIIWLRRRKSVHCDNSVGKSNNSDTTEINQNCFKSNKLKQSESLNIIKPINKDENKFGKSAPIDIVQNGKILSYMTEKDADLLEIDNVGETDLKSIEDDLDFIASVNLPGSGKREKFSFSRQIIPNNSDKPVIIKATTNAKVSPKDSFLETKYTEEVIQINNEIETNNEKDLSTKRDTQNASPPMSLCSIQSGDSGKGSSPPSSETITSTSYEFLLPTTLIGQLYGRKRAFINQLQSKAGVHITVKKHPLSDKVKICVIEGTMNEVNTTISLIRNKLPQKRYPNLTLQRIHFATPQSIVPLTQLHRSCLQLKLIEGINNDVIVTSIISGGHIFLQLPLHPSHPSLSILQRCLNACYSSTEAPLLPEIADDAICVGNFEGMWYRLQIVKKNVDKRTCLVKFIDFGGYTTADFCELRQIRADFMLIPFQAIECLLSNVEPRDPEWSSKAADVLRSLTGGIVLQAQVAGYNSENIPEIYLYACIAPNNVIFINKELVARNFAKWCESEHVC